MNNKYNLLISSTRYKFISLPIKNLVRFALLCFILLIISNSNIISKNKILKIGNKTMERVEEDIWKLEESYFSNLYKANYDSVLALAHSEFLGWPGGLAQPIDYKESAEFMKKLIPEPTSCTISIERKDIRILRNVALTQYILNVTCSDKIIPSSRICHTWIKEGKNWKLLGGMSFEK